MHHVPHRYDEARELLHLPEHVFRMLAGHADDEHADRNMATHLVQFSRDSSTHLLVSAHPLFRNSAFIMGNVNEPPKGAPSMELHELRLALAEDDDPLMLRAGLKQRADSVRHYAKFVEWHPEVETRPRTLVALPHRAPPPRCALPIPCTVRGFTGGDEVDLSSYCLLLSVTVCYRSTTTSATRTPRSSYCL